MDFFLGGIINFGGNFSPKDWVFCAGQLIPISQNQALYAILGTTWGGDGRTTFAVPDLRSRVPIGVGRGDGLTEVQEGRAGGNETYTLKVAQMPTHSHNATFNPVTSTGSGITATATATATMAVSETTSNSLDIPNDAYLAKASQGFNSVTAYNKTKSTKTLATDAIDVDVDVDVTISGTGSGITGGTVTIDTTGGNAAFPIMQPSLGIHFLMCMQGTFPSRN
jgi:microcystin-dependent protein